MCAEAGVYLLKDFISFSSIKVLLNLFSRVQNNLFPELLRLGLCRQELLCVASSVHCDVFIRLGGIGNTWSQPAQPVLAPSPFMGLWLLKVPELFYFVCCLAWNALCSAFVIEERGKLFLRSFPSSDLV